VANLEIIEKGIMVGNLEWGGGGVNVGSSDETLVMGTFKMRPEGKASTVM